MRSGCRCPRTLTLTWELQHQICTAAGTFPETPKSVPQRILAYEVAAVAVQARALVRPGAGVPTGCVRIAVRFPIVGMTLVDRV